MQKKQAYDIINGEYNVKEFIVEVIGASVVISLLLVRFCMKTDIVAEYL